MVALVFIAVVMFTVWSLRVGVVLASIEGWIFRYVGFWVRFVMVHVVFSL